MPHLPKIVSDRLRGPMSGTDILPDRHPDADLLTAFAEKSLTAPERARVTEHLGYCADCRDVVALALPGIESVDARSRAVTSRRAGWFRWSVLRWSAVAAGIAIAATAGILELQHRQASTTVASNALYREQAASKAAPAPADRRETDRLAADRKEEKDRAQENDGARGGFSREAREHSSQLQARPETLSPPPTDTNETELVSGANANASRPLNHRDRATTTTGVAAGGASGVGSVLGGPGRGAKVAMPAPPRDLAQNVPQNFAQKSQKSPPPTQALKQLPRESPRPGSSSETVEVTAQNQTVAVAAAPAPIQPEPSLQARDAEPAFSDHATVAKAKSPVINGDTSSASSAPAPPTATTSLQQDQLTTAQLYSAPAARWTISSGGGLQRSFDGGKSWQDANFNVATTASANYMLATTAPAKAATGAVAKQSKDKTESAKKTNAKIVFRAVFAADADVWAGGSGGMLYHSIDGGEQWSRVRPSTANEFLTDDIVGIEFSDGMHGEITTSRPEVWTTSDAGQSWQKQKQ